MPLELSENGLFVKIPGWEEFPNFCCYSVPWEYQQYGIGKGHRDGIWGQFPEVDWERDMECVMEQIYAMYALKDADIPEPGFKVKKTIVRI